MQLTDATRLYFNHLAALGRSRYTIRGAKSALRQLLEFLVTLQVDTVAQLDHDALLRYREELAWRLTAKGIPLAVRSQLELISHVASFCGFGVKQGWWLVDPSQTMARPKKPAAACASPRASAARPAPISALKSFGEEPRTFML